MLAQGLKEMYSAYGNSIITQDQEGGIAKGSLDPLHIFQPETVMHILAFPPYKRNK